MSKIKITQIKSFIKKPRNQKLTLKALGLKKIGQSIIHEKSNVIDGMIEKVKHLIKVEKIQ
ncbi:MAG: 50S ribosomal protein L30 [Bacteroidota bacterium]|nr:50S ribosomal protein L30 [Bacteroidota bacterium]